MKKSTYWYRKRQIFFNNDVSSNFNIVVNFFSELSPQSSVRSLLCAQHHFVAQLHSSLLKWRSLVYLHDLRGENWVPTFSRARQDVDALDRIPSRGDPGIQSWQSRRQERPGNDNFAPKKFSPTPSTTHSSSHSRKK
jgi:hypothetical protein